MKKSLLRTISVCIVIVLMCGMLGCASAEKSQNADMSEAEIVDQMLAHISSKYGYLDYDVIGFFPGGWDHAYDLLNLKTEYGGTKQTFSVRRYMIDDEYRFDDDYFGLLIKEDYDEAVRSCAEEYFDDFFVDTAPTSVYYPNELTGTSTFSDLLLCSSDVIETVAIVVVVNETFSSEDDFATAAKSFCADWKENGLPTLIRVVYVDQATFASVDRSNYQESGILTDKKITEYSE